MTTAREKIFDEMYITVGEGVSFRNYGTGTFRGLFKYSGTLTADRILTWNLNDAARSLSLAGDLALAGSLTTAGAFASTFTMTAATAVTFPVIGTLATLAGAEALSNKTITASSLNGSPVGASVPSTGAFTTLSATGLADLSAAGAGQVKFPATQNASADANTLDDYEEGNWTPVLTFTTPGNLSVVYSTQLGTYVKIGRQVTLLFSITTSTFTWTTASGAAQITGNPFTTAGGIVTEGSLSWQGITKASYTHAYPIIAASATAVGIRASGSGVAFADIAAADMPSAGTVILRGSITFFV